MHKTLLSAVMCWIVLASPLDSFRRAGAHLYCSFTPSIQYIVWFCFFKWKNKWCMQGRRKILQWFWAVRIIIDLLCSYIFCIFWWGIGIISYFSLKINLSEYKWNTFHLGIFGKVNNQIKSNQITDHSIS